VPGEVLADPAHVALEQRLRVTVLPRVDRLREVDQRRSPLPDQHVERGQVPVDHIAVQEAFDGLHDLVEQVPRLGGGRSKAV
jgi:hypothetical protein